MPPLIPLLKHGTRVLEVGCGIGWIANSLTHYYDCRVTAVDFNGVALARASEVAKILNRKLEFIEANLFHFTPEARFPAVVSLGVLADCLGAVRRLCGEFAAPGGYVLPGLYHTYGRRPFLDFFAEMEKAGASEDSMFAKYRSLHAALDDDVHALSWFRDQVLHPHETQITLGELATLFEAEFGFPCYELARDLPYAPDGFANEFFQDRTHVNEKGADLKARLIAKELIRIGFPWATA